MDDVVIRANKDADVASWGRTLDACQHIQARVEHMKTCKKEGCHSDGA